MSYFGLMNDFVEGTLAHEKEGELFMALSSNDELRNQLKQLMNIQTAIKNKKVMSTPPIKSTAAIFGAIGVDIPSDMVLNPIKTPLGTKIKTFYQNYSQAIVSGSIATIVTVAVMLTSFQFTGSENSQADLTIENFNHQPLIMVPTMTASQEILETASLIPEELIPAETKNTSTQNTRTIVKYVYVDREQNTETMPVVAVQDVKEFKSLPASVSDDFATEDIQLEMPVLSREVSLSDYTPATTSDISNLNDFSRIDLSSNSFDWSVEMKGATNIFDANTNVLPTKLSALNNAELSVLIPISEDFTLGADIKQETFFQKFRGLNDVGMSYTYEQRSNFSTISGLIRYDIHKIGDLIPLFAQLSFGGNSEGMVGRAMVGLKYTPYAEFSFIVGAELSQFYYHYQQEYFNTQKTSLNYGISYNF